MEEAAATPAERGSAWSRFAEVPEALLLAAGDGSVSAANERACDLLGAAEADLIGRPLAAIFRDSDTLAALASLESRAGILDVACAAAGKGSALIAVMLAARRLADGSLLLSLRRATRAAGAELEARSTTRLLEAVRRVQSVYIQERDARLVCASLLAELLNLTSSRYGLIAVLSGSEVSLEPQHLGCLHTLERTRDGDRYCEREVAEVAANALAPLLGRALRTGNPVLVSDSAELAGLALASDGQELRNLLVLPLCHAEAVIGLVAVANAPDGYAEELPLRLEPVLSACGGIIAAHRDLERRRDIERALTESQRARATLLANLPGMAFRRLDAPGWPHELVSEGARGITGYEPEALLDGSVGFLDLVLPADRARLRQVVERAIATREPYQLAYRLRAADGAERSVWEQGRAVYRDSGAPGAIEGFIADISDRVRAERAVADIGHELSSVLGGMSDLFFAVDREWRFLYLNPQTSALIGRFAKTRGDLIGRVLWDQFPRPASVNTGLLQKAMDDRVPVEFEIYYDPLETWFEIRAFPSAEGLSFYCRDVSERKRSELAAAQRAQQFQAVLEATTSLLEQLDGRRSGSILLTAALRETGAERGFLAALSSDGGLRVLARAGGGAALAAEAQPERIPLDGSEGGLERAALGEALLFESAAAEAGNLGFGLPGAVPPRNALLRPLMRGAEVVGILALADRDEPWSRLPAASIDVLTEAASVWCEHDRRREQVAHAAAGTTGREQRDALVRLAGGVAHDMNGLITAIEVEGGLLLRDVERSDPRRARLDRILETAVRMGRVTTRLLALCGEQRREPELLDLRELLPALSPQLAAILGDETELRLELAPDLDLILMDRPGLALGIEEVARNAREAGAGTLLIAARNVEVSVPQLATAPDGLEAGRYVVVELRDTGEGMQPEQRARAFEPFFSTRKTALGIGLAILQRGVGCAGGAAAIASEPGAGTTVSLYLPRRDAADRKRSSRQTPAATGRSTPDAATPMAPDSAPPRSVLLAEDEASVRTLLREVLELAGYEVLSACDGESALQLLAERGRPVDILLTDLVMPGLSGYELAARVLERCPQARVLVMSGYDATRAAGRPALPFLRKPFSLTELNGKLAELLGNDG